ncbi:MAG: NADH-quinone oxidoreductase subunit NuoG [Chloroflexi bacterium]|nr:NADH-quinone oxidoreductase subunit NuoG [Chloroflexota bacterium]
MPDLVTLTIDDVKVTVPAGTLVVDAAKTAGIEIPVFCSHPKLDPLGACRMCTVEFVGPRGSRLDTACTVRVAEGMAVRTNTEQVKKVREANLGFILINHPLDCPICDKGGECPLQDQTVEYGPGVSKFIEPKRHKQKHYPISDLIMLDQERCILCWRCIRYLEEWEDKPQLGLFERGGETRIDTFPERPVDAATSGSIIDICPVGALTNRVSRFRYRPWELKKTPSVCNHCPVGCNLRLDERVHELRRIVARENMAVNDEWICDKGRFVHQFVDHPERLAKPMVRDDGKLREATWDEALGRIVEKLGAVADAGGPTAIGGVASARVSNEAAYLFQKFFRSLIGTNNVDFPGGAAVRGLPTGFSAISDIAKSDLIVLIGFDPSEAAPLLDLHIKRAVRRAGAKLLIVNPRRIELARYTPAKGAYLPVLPGNETVLLNELVAAILVSRSANPQIGKSQIANRKSPTGTTQYAIRSTQYAPVIELLTAAKSPLFIYGPDAATGERGRAAVLALTNLAVALGQGDKLAYIGAEANEQGARDMGLLPDMLPGHQPISDGAVRDRLGKLWGVQPPAEVGQSYSQMIGGGVKGLFVMGENPAAQLALAETLRKLDFLVVQDLFLTETAQLADVLLPACSFAEADGTCTNLERRVQRGPQGIRAVGESQPDWAILAALAEKWLAAEGRGDPLRSPEAGQVQDAAPTAVVPDWKRKKTRKAKTGPAPKPWNYPNAQTVLEEIGKAVPFYAALRWDALGEGGVQWPISALVRSPRKPEGADVAPVAAPAAGSWLLVSGPLLWDAGLFMQHAPEQVRKLTPEPFVVLNPADLTAAKLAEGSKVTVTSPRGSVTLTLKADVSVQPGTAWVPAKLAGLPAETLGAATGESVSVTVR